MTLEQLEVAWKIERERLMEHCRRSSIPGWRPAAWWWFEAREPKLEGPAAEAARLAELGELTRR